MAMFVGSILQNYGKRCSLRFGEACTEFIIIYLKAKIKPRHACIQQRFQTETGPLRLTSAVHCTPHNSATQLHEKSMSHKMAIKYWQEDDVAQRRWLLRESTSDTSSHSPSRDQYKPSKSGLNTHNFAKKFLYPVPAGRVKKKNLETTLRTHQDR